MAMVSDSEMRENPSMAEPSNPMPSANALSNSAGAMATDLRVPRMSLNQSRTIRISRSSTARSTYSCWESMGLTIVAFSLFDVLPAPTHGGFAGKIWLWS